MIALPATVDTIPEGKPVIGLTDIVAKAQRGDSTAFERLYRDNVGRVHAVCLRMVVDSSKAEELTQDVFVRAWQMLPSFRGESAFSSWLHRLAVNVVLVYFRTEKRREARITAVEDLSNFQHAERQDSPGGNIDLERAIATLPPQARTIFVLHDIEGHKHEEIGELLGLATGTCKAQLHRARKLLMERLQ